jgi:anti-sigma B factor antagonist
MAISHEDIGKELRRITLSGRLDFQGVEEIAEPFALLVTVGRNVVVDLTETTLICSMGIRTLILNAKAVQHRGGQMALVVVGNTVASATLRVVGINALLPVFENVAEAESAMVGQGQAR